MSVGVNGRGRDGHPIGLPDDTADALHGDTADALHGDTADALHGAGARLFTVGVSGPDHDLDGLAEWVAWRDQHNA
ncbi:hypothetical protein ACF3NT_06695 [Naumannella halotolerans]|uniref:hypothetical protein n=1 Tax=Naumannella halotolerans TaxID=993414 RepID=UPI00370D1ED5